MTSLLNWKKYRNYNLLNRILYWLSLGLIVVYVLNIFSPLRLHVDTLRYFAIKDCIEFGCPPDSFAANDYLPYGYTATLILLSKLGLLKSYSIVFLNCAFLFGGLYFLSKIISEKINIFFWFLISLLSWITIKFTVHPLSEMQYFFFSALAIYFFVKYTRSHKLLNLAWSFFWCALAFLTRSVGVTLGAALVLGFLWHHRIAIKSIISKNKVIPLLLVTVVVLVFVFARQLGLSHYTQNFEKQFNEGMSLKQIAYWHGAEWTEMMLNTSLSRFNILDETKTAPLPYVLLGYLFAALFFYLLLTRKNTIAPVAKIYLVLYSLLIFFWPFYDTRFWSPVLPLMVPIFINLGHSTARLVKVLTRVWLAEFALLGILACGFMTYTSLNKNLLPSKQANGEYQKEYEMHFFGKESTSDTTTLDRQALDVLNRYDPYGYKAKP